MRTSCESSGDGGDRSLPYPWSSMPPARREQCGVKRGMVEIELDAARALADLAGMAAPIEQMVESADSSNGERDYCETRDSESNKRSKSESPVRAQVRSLREANIPKSEEHLNDDGHEGYVTSQGRIDEGMQMLTEHNHGGIDLNVSSCPADNISDTGGRAKQNLTEAEKDARRLRRILANRESARQTIRRRQALREELTRRVADLSMENKNMRMEKEHVLKEYLSLRDRNEQLKEQIAKTEKTACVSSAEAESCSSSPSTPPFNKYGKSPSVPHVILPWLSTSDGASGLYWHGDPSGSAGAASLYTPPCAWYYPFDRELPVTCPHNPVSADDSDRRQSALHPFLSVGGEYESHVSDRKPDQILLTAFDILKENTVTSSRGVPERMHGGKHALTSSSKDNGILSMTIGLSPEGKGDPRGATGVQERLQSVCTRSPEKPGNAAATAEARRRRKELTKLKHLNGR